jgi:hypothetical protein
MGRMKSRFKEEIKGRSERHFIFREGRETLYFPRGEKEHHFVRRFPGYARSSFWYE